MGAQKNKFNFQKYLFPILLLVLILVATTGTYVYRQISTIVADVTEKSQPVQFLLMAKSTMSDVYNADNSIKSYRLTEDTSYVLQFFSSVNKAEEKLNEFNAREWNDETKVLIDSFTRLIESKFVILNELLEAERLFRVQQALDKITYQLTPIPDKDLYDEVELNYIRRGQAFLQQLIKGKKGKKQNNEISIEELQQGLSQLKHEEETIEKLIKTKELILIEKDRFLTKKLQNLINYFELLENQQLSERKRQANKAMKKTNRQVVLFCITTGLLILLMAYILINFIQNNNSYRKAMSKARKNAEREAENKERFLANMSHEIRTPINSIAGFTEQLSQSTLNTEQLEQLNYIRSSADHLIYVVNDVLDLAKMDKGKFKFHNIHFNLHAAINDCVQLIKPLQKQQDNDFKLSLHVSESQILVGDPHRLKQIIINLLSNANKFTKNGLIQLAVNIETLDDKNCKVLIQIKDNGEGMTQEQTANIFNEFEQFNNQENSPFSGSGLGLSIVKKLLEQAKGEIDFISRLKVGTTVNIKIPYKIGKSEELLQQNPSLELPAGLHILVVDDELYNRKLITTILDRHNVKYRLGVNGKEAFEICTEEKFDIILMDERMPILSGTKASKKIRTAKNSLNKKSPIIAITAAITPDSIKEFENIKFSSLLAKPFKEYQLIEQIHIMLNSLDKKDKLKEKDLVSESLISFDELSELSNGSEEFYIDMLQTFLDGTEKSFKAIDPALEKGEYEKIRDLAHKICSPCRHLSALQFLKALKDIEKSTTSNGIEDLILRAKEEYEKIKPLVIEELEKHINGFNLKTKS